MAEMKLAVLGINHRTAPVEVRERLAFRPEEVPSALLDLQARGAAEALILSTCNRVEVTAVLEEGVLIEDLFEGIVRERAGLPFDAIVPHTYLFEDREAIRHIFRVASSLDSMIVGEPQILGQLKEAYAQGRDAGSVGSALEAVLTRAFNVAKRIRSETEIGQSAVSVSFAAVELARQIFGSLSKKRVLIIGAGKMSESAARHLIGAGATEIFITNRTAERAAEVARLFHGEIVPYDLFARRLAEIDIVIASSAAPGYVLTREMVRRALEERKNQPMFLIDVAVPRNLEPEINLLEHVFLYDIDDLQKLAERNLQARREVAQQAEGIVLEEVARMEARLREREVAPVIVSLQAQLDAIRREALARYRPKLGVLSPEQEAAIDSLTRAIINKVAHGPISEMRSHAAEEKHGHEGRGELVTAVRRIFRLRDQ